jgi:hypothetical protein
MMTGGTGMADVEHLTRLLVHAGGLDDGIAGILRTADNAWVIRFPDVDVEVEYDASGARLVFASVIGPVPLERRAEILESLLTYSFAARQTGGVSMALTGPGGDALQMFSMPADSVAADRLVTVASNLAENTRIWRGLFGAAMGAAGREAAPSFDHMIRI